MHIRRRKLAKNIESWSSVGFFAATHTHNEWQKSLRSLDYCVYYERFCKIIAKGVEKKIVVIHGKMAFLVAVM